MDPETAVTFTRGHFNKVVFAVYLLTVSSCVTQFTLFFFNFTENFMSIATPQVATVFQVQSIRCIGGRPYFVLSITALSRSTGGTHFQVVSKGTCKLWIMKLNSLTTHSVELGRKWNREQGIGVRCTIRLLTISIVSGCIVIWSLLGIAYEAMAWTGEMIQRQPTCWQKMAMQLLYASISNWTAHKAYWETSVSAVKKCCCYQKCCGGMGCAVVQQSCS